ncbi:MAG: hypothetical protein ACHBN1_06535 [Heteroscytonema crispum UTEX LB 1556]
MKGFWVEKQRLDLPQFLSKCPMLVMTRVSNRYRPSCDRAHFPTSISPN